MGQEGAGCKPQMSLYSGRQWEPWDSYLAARTLIRLEKRIPAEGASRRPSEGSEALQATSERE